MRDPIPGPPAEFLDRLDRWCLEQYHATRAAGLLTGLAVASGLVGVLAPPSDVLQGFLWTLLFMSVGAGGWQAARCVHDLDLARMTERVADAVRGDRLPLECLQGAETHRSLGDRSGRNDPAKTGHPLK